MCNDLVFKATSRFEYNKINNVSFCVPFKDSEQSSLCGSECDRYVLRIACQFCYRANLTMLQVEKNLRNYFCDVALVLRVV